MANAVAKQTLSNGSKNLVVNVNITGDGSGEETALLLIDVSTYNTGLAEVKLNAITANLTGCSATLLWDATTDVPFYQIPEGNSFADFQPIGGLVNTNAAGVTGDIMITTVGLGSGDKGTITLELVKK